MCLWPRNIELQNADRRSLSSYRSSLHLAAAQLSPRHTKTVLGLILDRDFDLASRVPISLWNTNAIAAHRRLTSVLFPITNWSNHYQSCQDFPGLLAAWYCTFTHEFDSSSHTPSLDPFASHSSGRANTDKKWLGAQHNACPTGPSRLTGVRKSRVARLRCVTYLIREVTRCADWFIRYPAPISICR